MKRALFLTLVFITGVSLFAQSASDYFPTNSGYVWFYKSSVLDSNNVPVDSSSILFSDSLAGEAVYNGKTAKIIMEAIGDPVNGIFLPAFDTVRVALEGSSGFLDVDLTVLVDTELFSNANYFNVLKSLSGWYDVYHFNAFQNIPYLVFQKDTTVEIDSVSIPLRFEIKGKRTADETLETVKGSFNCKKFVITSSVYYLQSSPLGNVPIPLVVRNKEVWIAPDNWIVKEFAPTRNVDLSVIGGPTFNIPGTLKILIDRPTGVKGKIVSPTTFRLEQNYPNPFGKASTSGTPSTVINYSIPNVGTAHELSLHLTVYDILGREVATLVNAKQNSGNYSVQFNASNLPSGIYFYTLKAGNFSITKKMLLLK